MDILIPFDFSELKWKPLSGHTGAMRRLSGVELVQEVWNRLHTGHQTLFLGIAVDFPQPLSRDHLLHAAKSSWQQLRHSHPLIATNIGLDASGRAQMTYHTGSQLDIDNWVERTFITHIQSGVNIEAVRTMVGTWNIPNSAGDQTFLHFIYSDSPTEGNITNAGFLFHTHHSPFDGVGLQTTASMYLDLLVTTITHNMMPLEWGTEISNLIPPALDVLKSEEPRPVADSGEVPSLDSPAYMATALLFQENQKVTSVVLFVWYI